jgi:hypothetical protein
MEEELAGGVPRWTFTAADDNGWRSYARRLLTDVLRADHQYSRSGAPGLPEALAADVPDAPLFVAIDRVLRRKRIPCSLKLEQIETMRDAVRGRTPLSGALVEGVDVDSIFLIEKRDRSYIPADRAWFRAREWGGAPP